MTVDENAFRPMPLEFPFDEIRLRAGESIEFSRLNPTYHRSVDLATAVSDRALYVRAPRVTFRRYWQRVELADIRAAELCPAPSRPWIPILLGTALAFLVAGAMYGNLSQCKCKETTMLSIVLLFGVPALIVWYTVQSVKSLRGRTDLVIRRANGTVRFRSPEDVYADEVLFDRKMLRETLAELGRRGLEVRDGCPGTN